MERQVIQDTVIPAEQGMAFEVKKGLGSGTASESDPRTIPAVGSLVRRSYWTGSWMMVCYAA